jgi:hypothetical protein
MFHSCNHPQSLTVHTLANQAEDNYHHTKQCQQRLHFSCRFYLLSTFTTRNTRMVG